MPPPRKFADPTYFPTLYRRQVTEHALAALRRASRVLNPPRLSLVPDKQKTPGIRTPEVFTNRNPVEEGHDGRSSQSA